jgi:RNA-directed DNA polymerase
MNELDQFVKHVLKAEHYIRYADDFVVLSRNKNWLESLRPQVEQFLWERLRLAVHPDKVFVKTFASGVDFLGWVHFPDHYVLRTTTKYRMLKRVSGLRENDPVVQSYIGLLSHGNTQKLHKKVRALTRVFR